jgi:hypothetical protein
VLRRSDSSDAQRILGIIGCCASIFSRVRNTLGLWREVAPPFERQSTPKLAGRSARQHKMPSGCGAAGVKSEQIGILNILERLSPTPKSRKVDHNSQWWGWETISPRLFHVIFPGRFRYLNLPCSGSLFPTPPASRKAPSFDRYPLRPDGRE